MNRLYKSKNISRKQKDRIIKSGNEKFELLEVIYKDDCVELKLIGVHKTVYSVIIHPEYLECDCPDFLKRNESFVFCKHLCFIIIDVGNIIDENIFILNMDEDYYERILFYLKDMIVNSDMESKFKEANLMYIKSIHNYDNECSICYLPMSYGYIFVCKKCNNCIHKTCKDRWLKVNATCVFCRAFINSEPEEKQYLTL